MRKKEYLLASLAFIILSLAAFVQFDWLGHLGLGSSTTASDSALSSGSRADNLAQETDESVTTGISERTFMEYMIPHHKEAVAAAKQVLARGANTEVKTLAQAIVVNQEKEITTMKTWYQDWYKKACNDDYQTYSKMMRDLSLLSGSVLDQAFVEDMIQHHTTALMTTQTVVPNIKHDEVKALATNIAETQSAEIITMRIILKGL